MTTAVSLRHLLGLLVAAVALSAALLWRQGTFDYALWHVHLNYNECARDRDGDVVCGADLEDFERRIAAVPHRQPAAPPPPPAPATETPSVPPAPAIETVPIPPAPASETPSSPPPPTAPTPKADALARQVEAGLRSTGAQSPNCSPARSAARLKIACTFEDASGRPAAATATRLDDNVLRVAVSRREGTAAGGTKVVQLGWTTFDTRTGQFGAVHVTQEAQDSADAQAKVRSIIPAIEAYFADNNTYVGMTPTGLKATYDASLDPSIYSLETATATTYCVASTAGGETWHKTGPAATIESGGCS